MTFAEILRETSRGQVPSRVAARLGVPVELVTAALEHAAQVGLVVSSGCDGCAPRVTSACGGCPLASR